MKKTILVTGASKGIGRAVAIRLARDGFDIAVHYMQDYEGAKKTLDMVKEQNREGYLIQFDISDREQCKSILLKHLEENAPYFGVILNAGITKDTSFPAMHEDEWDKVLRTNLDGFYNVLHPLIMPMVSARINGRIVVMSSSSGVMGNRGQVNYSATKAGLIGAAKSLAIELAKRNITVNCVAPGLIDTNMVESLPLEDIKNTIPMRRLGKTEDVAGAVSFLCSEDANYITRQVICVNGGMF
jgi:3-oxoacyl-[acyl-carrier protein] reductase